ncbi:MAG: CHAT domain-containing protein [Lewinellaceae bacterium]|nr:CHAT domain-containing protein [Lewinellaceae bacterium]
MKKRPSQKTSPEKSNTPSKRGQSRHRGIDTAPAADQEAENQPLPPPLAVMVKNGHLKYARHPVIIGHFKGDGIVSAESEMDFLLKNKLSERESLGLYPGAIGTNLVVLPEEPNTQGAIIIGLGEPENLTPFLLSKATEMACLEYLLRLRSQPHPNIGQIIGISALLVGSGYANLSLSNSINAILEGVNNANIKTKGLEKDIPLISEVEFMELYRDKALNAFYILDKVSQDNSVYNIRLARPVKEVEGKRTFLPLEDERAWWKRITASLQAHPDNGQNYIHYSASTGRARIEVRSLFVDPATLEELLAGSNKKSTWDRELAKTIFELLVPNDFKIAFRDRQNILLILDKAMAWYPWELLHYDKKVGRPICVSTGLIRQLSTSDDRRKITPVNDNKALIIGDPILSSNLGISQLPQAEEEAKVVDGLLRAKDFSTTLLVRKSFKEIISRLYDDYKAIHIASHGVTRYGPDKKTGILLSDNVVLTAAEIDQISTTPELVFVNCCYLGETDPAREQYFRDKYRLAANIGTQFIENGVKAAVVAGWAVDDAAASLFAREFYNRMLDGEYFGDAVREARAACYREFPATNTWGAYQCYGDPFYQLVKKKKSDGADVPYVMDKEILIDLEKFINDARFAKTRASQLPDRLKTISRKIEESGLRNCSVTELEAIAYAEIEEFETAITKYESLFEENMAYYSVKAIEQWCNLRGHHLVVRKNKMSGEEISREMEAIIGELQHLLELGRTPERYSLLGSAFKRKSVLAGHPEDKRAAIEKMADNYRDGFLINNAHLQDKRIYPLINWIIAECILNDDVRMQELEKILRQPAEAFLESLLAELNALAEDKKEFWDLIQIVNINQCKLLFSQKPAEQKAIVGEIKKVYRRAWMAGGSLKFKNSEATQMEFIKDSLAIASHFPQGLSASIDALIKFFRMNDPK